MVLLVLFLPPVPEHVEFGGLLQDDGGESAIPEILTRCPSTWSRSPVVEVRVHVRGRRTHTAVRMGTH